MPTLRSERKKLIHWNQVITSEQFNKILIKSYVLRTQKSEMSKGICKIDYQSIICFPILQNTILTQNLSQLNKIQKKTISNVLKSFWVSLKIFILFIKSGNAAVLHKNHIRMHIKNRKCEMYEMRKWSLIYQAPNFGFLHLSFNDNCFPIFFSSLR